MDICLFPLIYLFNHLVISLWSHGCLPNKLCYNLILSFLSHCSCFGCLGALLAGSRVPLNYLHLCLYLLLTLFHWLAHSFIPSFTVSFIGIILCLIVCLSLPFIMLYNFLLKSRHDVFANRSSDKQTSPLRFL